MNNTSKKPAILYLSPGPSFHPEAESYQREYLALSESYDGYILTSSNRSETLDIGSFKYSAVKIKPSLLGNIKYVIFCIRSALRLKRDKKNIDLVVTYDPLKTGIIGVAVSNILNAKFAPQVNGVYTAEAEWIDTQHLLSSRIKKKIYPIIMKWVLKRADGIKLLFDSQLDYFGNMFNGKIIKSFACYVAVEQFSNIREDKEILFAGFPFKRKGVDILIEAFKEIAPKYPDWKLKILGWFPDTSALYKAIDNHPQIYHHPPVHGYEMPDHIGVCSILVLPSRSEGMGRVLVEAMAAGKPRIGSNIEGIPKVINDGVDGYLVEPGDVHDLATKLENLMCDANLRNRMGAAAKDRVSKEFTIKNYISNLDNFYTEVLNKN